MGKYGHFKRSVNLLTPMGLFQFICSVDLDTILINISLWVDCLFEIRKVAVCFLWLSLPSHYRVTDEALLAEST